jgi:hypothetical protein
VQGCVGIGALFGSRPDSPRVEMHDGNAPAQGRRLACEPSDAAQSSSAGIPCSPSSHGVRSKRPLTSHGTWHMAQGTWHMAQGTWHRAHGTWHMAQGTWHRAHGTWHMAHGTWHMAQGLKHSPGATNKHLPRSQGPLQKGLSQHLAPAVELHASRLEFEQPRLAPHTSYATQS